jgi:hypothetical protein
MVAISLRINVYVRKLVRPTQRSQFLIEWSIDNPEYFDPNIDMYSSWYKTRESFPVERGVFQVLLCSQIAEFSIYVAEMVSIPIIFTLFELLKLQLLILIMKQFAGLNTTTWRRI